MSLQERFFVRRAPCLTIALMASVIACGGASTFGAPSVVPPVPGPSVPGAMQVNVDAGEVLFTPLLSVSTLSLAGSPSYRWAGLARRS